MESEWVTATVAELIGQGIIEKPIDGNHGATHPKGRDFVQEGIPFVMASDLINGQVDIHGCKFITKEQADSLRKGFSIEGDVLLSHKATLGRTAIVGPIPTKYIMLTPQVTYYRIINQARLNRLYLKYYFDSNEFQNTLVSWGGGGSTRLYLGITEQHKLPIKLPPIKIQRVIANILGSLDDRIELNRRMNSTLEAMARTIFKSWFVDFDPVRAKIEGRPTGLPDEIASLFPDSFEDSELGEIPKGWKVVALPEIIDINPSRKLKKGQVAPYLEMKNLSQNTARAVCWCDRNFSSGVKFINGDTLMARITPCLENGKGAFVDFLEDGQVGWGSTEYIVFRAKEPLPLEYSYFLSRTKDFRSHAIVNMTGSSGRQRVPASIFDDYLVVRPSENIAESFGIFSGLVMRKIKENDEMTRSLASLRDTLLPKLISGELRVPDAERFIEEAGL